MKRKIYIFSLLLLLTSCGADKHLKRGDQFMAIGEYYEASLEYAKAYSKTPPQKKEERGMRAYKVAESNRRLNYTAKALAAYRNAARYKYTDTLTYYYMGELERQSRDYKSAAKSYQLYLDNHPADPGALLGLQSCAAAPAIREKGSEYTVHEDQLFNARYDDYSPALSEDQIFFSSTRKEATGDDANGVTGMKSGDIFTSKKDDKGKWKRPELVEGGVNTAYDEGACCLSPDGKTMYFTRCRWDSKNPRLAEIYSSSRSDASWGAASLCEISKDTLSNYAHPAVSPDGRYLYFVSDMPGGLGGTDIWRASLTGHGIGAVENLGAPINSSGNERFPTFRPNGDLYYSSDGKISLGGLDLYCAKFDSTTNQWDVSHLPYPMNSNGDDFGMTFDGLHNRGFFSSNRSNLRGWDKIYSFNCPEIIQVVKGWVYEQDGYELPKAQVFMIGDDGTNTKLGLKLDGSFEQLVKPGVHYLFLAVCEGYMNYRQTLYLPPNVGSVDTTFQFPLPSLTIPVLVRNVFYAYNKAEILPQSLPALNKLTELLKENPSIAIELSSHCDYRGSEAYNERLSQHRAESVVKYLISHGISEKRVVAHGYGKKRPKVITPKFAEKYPFLHAGDTLTVRYIKRLKRAQQDSCNALNRRTEFSVLHTTFGMFDEKGNLKPEAILKKDTDTTAKPSVPIPAQKVVPAAANQVKASIKGTKVVGGKAVKTSVKESKKVIKPKKQITATTKKDSVAATKVVKPVKKDSLSTQKTISKTATSTKKTVSASNKVSKKTSRSASSKQASTTATNTKMPVTTKVPATEVKTPVAKSTATETKPAATTTKPTATETKPAATTTKPTATETKPAATTTKPTATEAKPAATTTKPAATETKPAATTTKPAATETKPAATTTKPTAVEKPVTPTTKAPVAKKEAVPAITTESLARQTKNTATPTKTTTPVSASKNANNENSSSSVANETKKLTKEEKKAAEQKAKEEKKARKLAEKKAKEIEKARKKAEKTTSTAATPSSAATSKTTVPAGKSQTANAATAVKNTNKENIPSTASETKKLTKEEKKAVEQKAKEEKKARKLAEKKAKEAEKARKKAEKAAIKAEKDKQRLLLPQRQKQREQQEQEKEDGAAETN